MELKDIRSRNDFIEFLKGWDEVEIEDADLAFVADWFIANQDARMVLSEFGTKDVANMFLEGVVGINQNPEEYHKDWWSTTWENVDEAREIGDHVWAEEMEDEQVEILTNALRKHFNIA